MVCKDPKPHTYEQSVIGDIDSLSLVIAAVPGSPMLDRRKSFALISSKLPGHVEKAVGLDSCDLDEGRCCSISTQEYLPLTWQLH